MSAPGEAPVLAAVTRGGAAHAARLAAAWPGAELVATERIAPLLADLPKIGRAHV